MAKNVDGVIDDILRREGGYTDNPKDRGHQKRVAKGDKWDSFATNRGVTQERLSDFLGRQATLEEVQGLTEATARAVYKQDFRGIDRLPESIQELMADAAINHGPGGAARILQKTLRKAGHPVSVDGDIGPQTLAAANDAHGMRGAGLTAMLLDERRQYYERIIRNDPTQEAHRKGWMNRLKEFETSPLV